MSSLQIGERTVANLGLMFARQSVPAAYDRQRSGADPEEISATRVGGTDSVTLSASVPRPFSADEFERSVETGKTLASGGKVNSGQAQTLRQDRVLAAVSALAMLGEDGAKNMGWPGGIPVPTAAELDEARRRLSQRLRNLESAADAEAAQRDRIEIIRAAGSADLAGLAHSLSGAATTTKFPGMRG